MLGVRENCLVLALCLCPGLWASAGELPAANEAETGQLIQQLGAAQFVLREEAQQKLQRLGIGALDALLEAQHDSDIEIASRARYLLNGIHIPWSADADVVEAKAILRHYEDASREARKGRMEQLARLEDSAGIVPLCRLARFEADPVLSKRAALLIMSHAAPREQENRAKLVERIRTALGGSKRPASEWLALYTATLLEVSATLEDWARISAAEEEVLVRFPEETDRLLVRDLLRFRAELLLSAGRDQDASTVLRRTVDLMGHERQELFDTLDWCLERRVWTMADELAKRFPDQFQEDGLLLYRWAEAQRQSGNAQLAEETAQLAFSLQPQRYERHLETAQRLIERALYDWAERELRHVMAAVKADEETGFEARFYLSNLLLDLERAGPAAEVLQEAVAALDGSPPALQKFNQSASEIRALMHYRFALHYQKTGDHSEQRKRLEAAIRDNPADIDVLIAMYQMPGADADWRQHTVARIRAVAGRLRDEARQYEEIARHPLDQRLRSETLAPLASLHNQYAWLIGNTEGDLQEALRVSRRSLEISPDNSAYFDTLARCHYALRDLENAVRCQSRAVQLEPGSQQIRRQLELYQKELARTPSAAVEH